MTNFGILIGISIACVSIFFIGEKVGRKHVEYKLCEILYEKRDAFEQCKEKSVEEILKEVRKVEE
jgi:hypothetical protein